MLFLGVLMVSTASAAVLPKAELEGEILALAERAGGPVLAGAAGSAAQKALAEIQQRVPASQLVVVSIPSSGSHQQQMDSALAQAELSCGLRVSALGSSWMVSEFGSCGAEEQEVVAPVAEAAPVAAQEQTAAPTQARKWRTAPVVVPLVEPVEEPAAAVAEAAPQPASAASKPAPAAPKDPAGPLTSADLFRAMRAAAAGPDPNVALRESIILGFGAGHFYSGEKREGLIHMGLQAGGAALGVAWSLIGMNTKTKGARGFCFGVAVTGAAVAGADRVFDIYRAPLNAHKAAERRLRARE